MWEAGFDSRWDRSKKFIYRIMPINTKPHIHEMVICANIFVHKGGKYLLIKRSSHKTFMPNVVHPIGGKVDSGENPYLAAERELMEEAGIRVKNLRLEAVLMDNVSRVPKYKEVPNWLIFHFSGEYASGKVRQSHEGELMWLAPKEIKKQEMVPSVRSILDHILNPKDGTVFGTFVYDKNGKIIAKHTKIDVCRV